MTDAPVVFTELRNQLIMDLVTGSGGATEPLGVAVYGTWPARFNPPGGLLITPRSSDYIAAGQFPGQFEVSLELVLVVKKGTAEEELTALDELAQRVLMNTADWAFRGVSSVGLLNVSGSDYPGIIIRLARQAQLY